MSNTIPDSHRDLLEGPVPATLATLMPDGRPQLSVVWCNMDGDHILVNTARGRQKVRNIEQDPRVTLLVRDPGDQYRFLEVRGFVEEITEEGAVEHIDRLAELYEKRSPFFGGLVSAGRRQSETRIICRIKPTRVRTAG